MFKSSKIKRLFMQAWNNIDEGKRQSVINRYMAELEKYDTTLGERIDIANEEVAAAYAEEVFNNPGVWDYILSEEPSLKDRVIAFFKGAPKRYSFAPEMDAAAKRWIQEYKRIFDQVAARNAGMNVVEDVTTVERKEEIKKIGKLVDELGGTATQVPKKVIKKIGKLVPDENAESNKKTASGTKVQDSGERFASNIVLSDADLDEYMKVGKTKHTRDKKQRMLDKGKKPILTSKSEASEFIIKAIKGEALGEVKAYQKIGDRLASAISAKRNSLDLYGKYLEINADDLREAYKNHKQPKEKGDIALSDEEFANIPEYIDTFDGITSVDEYNGKVKAYLYKKSENGYYRILTVVSNERSSLQVTKMIGVSKEKFETKFQNKKERDTGSPRGQDASIPSTKARHTAGALSDNSIPQNSQNDKGFDKKSAKDFNSGERSALADGKRATAGEVAAVKSSISKKGIDPKGIIAIADKYFARYSGQLTRTGVRYEFLAAADMLFDLTAESGDRAYASVEALAEELVTNEKDKKPPIVSLYYKRSFLFDCGF